MYSASSKLERMATAIGLRSMADDRVEALVLINATRTPTTEDILNEFASADARRLKLIL